jgi:hypothetical protein
VGKLRSLIVIWLATALVIGIFGCAVETVSTPTPTDNLTPAPTQTPAPTTTPSATPSPAVPLAPTLSFPANGSNVAGTSVTYSWNASAGATIYRITVSTSSNITDTSKYKISFPVGNATEYTNKGYPNTGATYYWWVNAGNSFGWASQSQMLANGYSFVNGGTATPSSPTPTQAVNPAPTSAPSAPTPMPSPLNSPTSALTPTPTLPGSPPSAPTLISPTNEANVPGTGIIFKWSTVSGATHYLFELNTDPNWGTSTRLYYLDRAATSVAIGGLHNDGTTYYWRVSAANSYGWGSASDGWSVVNGQAGSTPTSTPSSSPNPGTSPTTPSAPTLISPANEANVPGTGIIFKWSAVSGATHYLFELNTDPNWGTSTRLYYLDRAATSVAIGGLHNDGMTYYWRVSAGNSYGWGSASDGWSVVNGQAGSNPTSTPSSSPTPSTTPLTPPAPALLSPGNGTNVAGTSMIFRWSAVSGATHYLFELNTDSNWGTSTRLYYLDWPNTSVAISNFRNDGTTYYWRVSAGNSYGWGAASVGWSVINGINTPPVAPTLSSPGNGTRVAGPSITFQWNAPLGATGYRLEVNTDPSWGTGTRLYYGSVSTNSQTVTGFSNDGTTPYYWRVWASNAYGWSAASATWSLISRAADGSPATPTLLSPANGSSEPGTSITFRWSASSGATHYLYEINTDPNWGPGTRFGYGDIPNNFCSSYCYTIANNGLVVVGFPNTGTIYYWRVWAGNSNGWSAATSGQYVVNGTSVPPATPTLTSPADGANVVGSSINFRWSDVSGATQYLLEVNTAPDFGTGTRFYYGNVPSYSWTVTGFGGNGTRYYWRVTAGNSYGWSNASAVRSIVNIAGSVAPLTTAPTLVSPGQGGVVMGDVVVVSGVEHSLVTFTWNPVEGATKYRLVATREDGSHVVDIEVGGVTSYTPWDLRYHVTPFIYHWMVWAGNDAGWCPDAAVLANECYFLQLYR